jgi:type II secretory ATPase GspE/PulE/Tfp pilus assembly ATPase PilB-like protein
MTHLTALPLSALVSSLPTLTVGQAATQPHVLVSLWKPLLLLLPIIPWALYVSKVLDKHAARFILPREKYNTVHLFVGLAAFIGALAIPLRSEGAFWAGFGILVTLLLADILLFINIHNKDERVPEAFRLSLFDFSKMKEASAKKKTAQQAGKAELAIRMKDKQLVPVPNADSPEFALRTASEKIYCEALEQRSSQAELAPIAANQYGLRQTTDGISTQTQTMPAADALKVIDFWKSAAKLDLAERRKRIFDDIKIKRGEIEKPVRVISQGTPQGPKLTLLLDPESSVNRKLAELGLVESQMKELKELVDTKGGTLLLAAGPDQGRTTTFYSIMRLHDAYTQNVVTHEVEMQGTLEGIKQNVFTPVADGPDFATSTRSLIRRDPDVIGVAELPDAQTAKELARADLQRTRVIASVRSDSAIAAIQGWVRLVGDAEQGSKVLRGVVAQKLVRKLCTNCRVPYAPSPDMLKKLGVTDGAAKQLYKKGGQVVIKDKPATCPMCGGGGFFGQEGVFEVVVLSEVDRQLIKAGDFKGLAQELRKRKSLTIQQAGIQKALSGVTSIEEVIRVTTEQAPAATSGAVPASPAAAPAASKPAAAASPAKKA